MPSCHSAASASSSSSPVSFATMSTSDCSSHEIPLSFARSCFRSHNGE
jgi:hypothetical protein